MKNPITQYRQSATAGRITCMQRAAVPIQFQTSLQQVEQFLADLPCLPVCAMAGPEFPGIDHQTTGVLEHVQQCHEGAVHLHYLLDQCLVQTWDRETVQLGASLYATEARRLLSGIFPPDDLFWTQYEERTRISLHEKSLETFTGVDVVVQQMTYRYGVFFAVLDAIHHQTAKQYKLAYQLMLQSLKWALTGYYLPIQFSKKQRSNALRNALKLVDSLHLSGYKNWLTALLSEDLSISRPRI